jgi:hypothetical protein
VSAAGAVAIASTQQPALTATIARFFRNDVTGILICPAALALRRWRAQHGIYMTSWTNQPDFRGYMMKKPIANAAEAKIRILADLRKVKGCEKTTDIEVEHRGQGWFVTHVHPGEAEMSRDKIFVEARKIAAKLT